VLRGDVAAEVFFRAVVFPVGLVVLVGVVRPRALVVVLDLAVEVVRAEVVRRLLEDEVFARELDVRLAGVRFAEERPVELRPELDFARPPVDRLADDDLERLLDDFLPPVLFLAEDLPELRPPVLFLADDDLPELRPPLLFFALDDRELDEEFFFAPPLDDRDELVDRFAPPLLRLPDEREPLDFLLVAIYNFSLQKDGMLLPAQ